MDLSRSAVPLAAPLPGVLELPSEKRRGTQLRPLLDDPSRRRSIAAKLTAIVVVFVAAILMLLAVTGFCFKVGAGLLGYVDGEGLWSKGQKDAVFYLTRYVQSRDDYDYRNYLRAIAIPQGDHRAREEMEKSEFDYVIVEGGFMQGGIDPADVPPMVFLFRDFRSVSYLAKAIRIWTDADVYIVQLVDCARDLHDDIAAGRLTAARAHEYEQRIEQINANVTPLERDFSYTLSDASRLIRGTMFTAVCALAVLMLGGGFWVSWRIASGIRGGINNLRDGALQVARGNLQHRVPVTTGDELGALAGVFNEMIAHRRQAADQLAERTRELERSNAELEHFAHIASHDLKSPLRTISGLIQLLQRRTKDTLDADAQEYMQLMLQSTQDMDRLIAGLLAVAQVGQDSGSFEPTDCNAVLDSVKTNLAAVIQDRDAVITSEPLPVLPAAPVELRQLFQNLIANAIKFQVTQAPRIHVSAVSTGRQWQFTFRDNGIGISEKDQQRIFQMFTRLHSAHRYEGSGLGLAICRKVVERHGGRIWVESQEGQGSRFCFTLNTATPN